jgi:hypothetical protein
MANTDASFLTFLLTQSPRPPLARLCRHRLLPQYGLQSPPWPSGGPMLGPDGKRLDALGAKRGWLICDHSEATTCSSPV